MWSEFRSWLLTQNVLALALAVIVGAALATVVTSLVNDIIMPPVGLLLGGVDFANLFIDLSGRSYPTLKAAKDAGAATINYGLFINNVITFVVVALIVFLIARTFAKPPAPAPTKTCPYCQETVAITATRCRYCTSELRDTAISGAAAVPDQAV